MKKRNLTLLFIALFISVLFFGSCMVMQPQAPYVVQQPSQPIVIVNPQPAPVPATVVEETVVVTPRRQYYPPKRIYYRNR